MRIRWTRRAAFQVDEEIIYLEEQRPGTGVRFHEAVRERIEIMRDNPRAFPRVPGVKDGEVRRALIGRFDHWIIYEVDSTAGQLVVLAVWSTRRRPSGWKS